MNSTGAREVALYAVEWLFSWMGSLVSLQSACIGTRELAQCATKRFFPCMSPHVVLESRNSFARVVALCAIERFFFWMGLHVCLENRSFFARVVALFANEKLAAITSWLTDTTWCIDCLHFCDRPSTKVEGQLNANFVRILGEGQWKVKVITYRHTSPLMTLYHLIPSSANLYRPSTSQYYHL